MLVVPKLLLVVVLKQMHAGTFTLGKMYSAPRIGYTIHTSYPLGPNLFICDSLKLFKYNARLNGCYAFVDHCWQQYYPSVGKYSL